ncbi:MAG TPA: hypothetical protein VGI76_09185 [Solirubrobacteraceae bacterium]
MRPRIAPLVCSLIALAALAGCGDSSSSGNGVASKSPSEIVSEAKTAADGASSVHVSGSIVNAGSTIALDMDLLKGTGGSGRLSQNGLSFELVDVGGSVYIKGSPEFYRHFAGGAAAQLLQGKWLKAPANTGSFASLGSLTDLRKLLDSTLSSHGSLSKGAPSTIEGQEAIGVKDVTRGGTLYVATNGKPFPLEITKGGSGGGKVTFTNWNAPVTVKAPAKAVDLGQLESGH